MSDVVITALGLETAAGHGVGSFVDVITSGQPVLAEDERLRALNTRARISGRLSDIETRFADLHDIAEREKRYFGRFAMIGYLAAREALSGVDPESLGARGGVSIGSSGGAMGELEDGFERVASNRRLRSPGYAVCRHMNSLLPSFLTGRLGGTLGGDCVSLGCTSGIVALRRGFEAIRRDEADWYLVGAIEEDSPHFWLGFDSQRLLAPGLDARSEPFGRNASGFVPSGGAAFVMLESRAYAARAGRSAIASVDAVEHRIAPCVGRSLMRIDDETYRSVVRNALRSANLEPNQIDLVLPHAISSPLDGHELELLDEVIGLRSQNVGVSTNRAMLGYAVAASGLIDVVDGALQLRAGRCSANRGLGPLAANAEPYADNLSDREEAPERLLKTAFAFGGGHAAVVMKAAS